MLPATVQLRLSWYAVALLYVAGFLAKHGLKVPHPWVTAVTNRSWNLRLGDGSWTRIRIDDRGRIQQ